MNGMQLIMDMIKKDKNIDYEKLKINLEKIAPTQAHFDNLLELLDFVYYLGVDDGESGGYKEALKEGGMSNRDEDSIYEEAYENARMDMQDEIDHAYDRGSEEGYNSGHDDGEREGYNSGHEDGEREGYDRGYEDRKNEEE